MPEAYPLAWPKGVPRTSGYERKQANFKVTISKALQSLEWEARRFHAQYLVISTNLPLRSDGKPSLVDHAVVDPGVCVYLERHGKALAFACDKWTRVADNLQAVHHTIDALRGIERWGSAEMVDRAFAGFAQLPAPADVEPVRPWWEVLGVAREYPMPAVEGMYRDLVKKAHPDKPGGSAKAVAELNAAIEQARAEKK